MGSNLEEQLDIWSKLASSLEDKLAVRADEIDRLRRTLRRKESEFEDLQEKSKYKSARISDLEQQCIQESAKVTQLSEVLVARQPAEFQDTLLHKSFECAEKCLLIDKLRLQLKHGLCEREDLIKQRDTATKGNSELAQELEEATSTIDKLMQDRERNNKMLLGMSDIVRTLNCVSVNYDKETSETGDSVGSHYQSVRNIKRKIEAMEDDRQRLVKECKVLREENESKEAKLSAMEAHFHSVNISRSQADDYAKEYITGGTSRKFPKQVRQENCSIEVAPESVEVVCKSPVSFDTSMLKQGHPLEADEQSSTSSSSGSSRASSFSSLDPPDIPMERFEAVKREYESALEKIIQLSTELCETKMVLQDLKNKESEDHLRQDYEDSMREIAILERDLADALADSEKTALKNQKIEEEYQSRITEKTKDFDCLKEKYDKAKIEYSARLESFEKEIRTSEEFYTEQNEDLKKAHQVEYEALSNRYNNLKRDHAITVENQRKAYEDLNFEYDTFLEMNRKTEDELSELTEEYAEAKRRIKSLEEKAEDATRNASLDRAKLEEVLAGRSKTEAELHHAVVRSRNAMQAAVLKYQKLKREHDAALSENGKLAIQLRETKQNVAEDLKEEVEQLKFDHENLVEYCSEVEIRLKNEEEEAKETYDQLKRSYEAALSKIEALGSRLVSAGIVLEQDGNSEERMRNGKLSRPRHELALEKVSRQERQLFENESLKKNYHIASFNDDYDGILKKVGKPTLQDDKNYQSNTQSSEGGLRCVSWYDRLYHHAKMRDVKEALNTISDLSEFSVRNVLLFVDRQTRKQDDERTWSRCLVHQRKLALVNQAVRAVADHNFVREADTMRLVTGSHGGLNIYHVLQHQRMLQIVHYDVFNPKKSSNSHSSSGSSQLPSVSDLEKNPRMVLEASMDDATCAEDKATTIGARGNFDGDPNANQSSPLGPLQKARFEINRLREELDRVKLVANTARIRYEAREKDLRVVMLQYESLLKEYNQAVANVSSDGQVPSGMETGLGQKTRSLDNKDHSATEYERIQTVTGGVSESSSAFEAENTREADCLEDGTANSTMASQVVIDIVRSRNDETHSRSEVEKLRKDLRAAELKVEIMSLELRVTKDKAEEARKKQEDRETDLRDVISQYRTLESKHEGTKRLLVEASQHQRSSSLIAERGAGTEEGEEEDVSGIFRRTDDGGTSTLPSASFDGSHLTSVCGSNYTQNSASGEDARDDKMEYPKVQFEDVTGRYLKLRHEHDAVVEQMSLIQRELTDAKKAEDVARQKQIQRELHLRDVIFQYKKLQSEHDALVCQARAAGGFSNNAESITPPTGHETMTLEEHMQLKAERDAAKTRITTIERELEAASKLAIEAKQKQEVREGHLRDVIYQYKTLEGEYSKLKRLSQKAKKKSPGEGGKGQPSRSLPHEEKRDLGLGGESLEDQKYRSYRNQLLAEKVQIIMQDSSRHSQEEKVQTRMQDSSRHRQEEKVQTIMHESSRHGQEEMQSKASGSQKSKSSHKRKLLSLFGLGHIGSGQLLEK